MTRLETLLQVEEEPLTAEFESFPRSHDGGTAFTLRIAYSEAVDITAAALRDDALDVTGTLRPSPPGTARGVPPRPASDPAAPRPRPGGAWPTVSSSSDRRHHPRTPSGRRSQSTRGTRSRRTWPGSIRMPKRLHRPVAPAATISDAPDHGPWIRAPRRKARVRSF